MQAVIFTVLTERDSFIAWLDVWWAGWWYDQQLWRVPIGDTGGYLGVSDLLTEDRRIGAVLRKAKLSYMLPKQKDPTSWVCYDGLHGFEWAIVSLGAERCEVEFTTHDERLLPFYWQALHEVILRWPDVQWIKISPPIEGSAPAEPKRKKRGASRLEDREPENSQIEAAIIYQNERAKGTSPTVAAQLAGIPDYRTAKSWIKAWPNHIERERRKRK